MERLRVTEAELARDLHPLLQKAEEGIEVIEEKGNRDVAVIKAPHRADLEEVISRHRREPWNPPSWN